jgi:hypothetical protein
MRVRRTSLLPCPMSRLIAELSRPALLYYVAAPMLVLDPVDDAPPAERWAQGRYRFRLLVGGRLPIGQHTINIQRTPTDGAEVPPDGVVMHDAGYGDLIKVWDHKILLEDFHGMTRYTDEVEIHAGPLTGPAWLFALAFFTHRQRRLSRLVASGFRY